MPLLIMVIGITLIVVNYYAIKKDKNSFDNVLMNQNEVHKDYDVELFAIRKDMAESILDLQKEIIQLREQLEGNIPIKEEVVSDDIVNKLDKDSGVISEINFDNDLKNDLEKDNEEVIDEPKDTKVGKIMNMVKSGYSDDEICESLKIGKGEVLLIKGLFK